MLSARPSCRAPAFAPFEAGSFARRLSRRLACLIVAGTATSLTALAPATARGQQFAVSRPAAVVRFASEVSTLENVPAQLRRPLTLHLQSVTVERALREVMAQTGLPISYSRAVVPLDRVVSVDVDGQPMITALRQVLGGSAVELWISTDGRMALVPAEVTPAQAPVAQQGTIAGIVRAAENGEPLSSVTVRVGSGQFAALTGTDGRYAIRNVPPGPVVVHARRIGYGEDSTRVVVVADQTVTADFSLRMLAVQLGEVVAIGYGTTTRRELTGAISTVTSDEIASAPIASVEQSLNGRAPGVQVTTASGQPGTASAVRIRGGNSITAGNDPLYVIDGVPMLASPDGANTYTLETQGVSGANPLAALNPNDIASVEVLKDASATAIYGARAANGVILITTKKGQAGKTNVAFGVYYGSQSVRHKLPLLDAQQFAKLANDARVNAGQPALYTPQEIASFGKGTDWQDAIFRTAPMANYDLSFNGGSETTRFYLSGNLLQQDGVVIGTGLDRGSVRLNLDQDVSSRFRVGTRFTLSRQVSHIMPNGGAGQEASSVVLNALTAPPTLPVKGSGGEYFIGLNPANGRFLANPVAAALLMTNEERQNRFVGNAFGEFDIVPHLTFRSSIGGDYLSSMQDFYSPSTTYPGMLYGGFGSRGAQASTTWLNENTLHYTRQLNSANNLDLLGGLTLQQQNADNISGSSQGFVTDALGQNGLNTGGTFLGVWSGAPHSSLLSYFARANWNLLDRYLFTATERVDGSSKFGEGNQYGYFPSAAFAWRASNEGFLKDRHLFDDLKFRVSYGRTGNQDIGNYRALATLSSSTYLFNGTKVTGYSPGALANPDLKWETTAQSDVGMDAAVLHSRLAVTADYYNKKTKDLLLEVPVPSTLGFTSMLQNVGAVQNKGFELGVNTVNLTGALGWTSSFNIAWNRNKVLNIGADTIEINPAGAGAGAVQNPTVLKVGQPINSFYGYVYSGMQNGQPTYADINGDTVVNTNDQTIIGNAQPDYTGGFANHFTYGNFGLQVFVQFVKGNKIYNINRAILTNATGSGNQLADAMNGGKDGVPVANVANSFDNRPSTLFVEDGSYIRGKNLRLDYTIPQSVLQSARLRDMSNVQLYVSLQNFFTKTKYTGFDPEVSEYATSVLAQGIDFGTYPQTRQFTIGFNAGF
ncbi:MAG TPA: TonB-dependent receptor [Gemmatimonadaceae bacterium]